MFALFSRVPSTLDKMRTAMSEEIIERGTALVQADTHSKVRGVLKLLLKMHATYSKVLVDAFRSNKLCQKTLKTAFESFVNRGSRCSKFLSVYVDDMMKRSSRGQDEQSMEVALNNIIVLFRYLNDKDVFENDINSTYASDFSQTGPLTLRRTHHDNMLKRECGRRLRKSSSTCLKI